MSNDTFTEVTNQSWFSRIKNALKGVIVGIILVIISFPLLFWNEGRAVKRHKTLEEGRGVVISVDAANVEAGNQGKLVHLTGLATTEESLVDEIFGVSSRAIKLRRSVEMYQWQEQSQSEEKKKLGGGTETTTTYTYSKTWASSAIDSSRFKIIEGHVNPGQMEYSSDERVAHDVDLGAFTLSSSLIRAMNQYSSVSLTGNYELPENLINKATVHSNTIYLGSNPSSSQVGDIKVQFTQVLPMDISIIAQQTGQSFTPYRARAGGTIELLKSGVQTAESMFEKAQQSNTILTWVLRLVGFIIMLIGFQMILAPLSVFADVLPLLGNIVEAGTGLVAGLLAGMWSSVTIAIAWIVYRPVIGIIILVVSAAIGAVLFLKLKNSKVPETTTAPA